MLESIREIHWFGNNGSISYQNRPSMLKLTEILPELFPESTILTFNTGQIIDFAVVKIFSSWSKTMSLTNLVVADLRAVNQQNPHNKV